MASFQFFVFRGKTKGINEQKSFSPFPLKAIFLNCRLKNFASNYFTILNGTLWFPAIFLAPSLCIFIDMKYNFT